MTKEQKQNLISIISVLALSFFIVSSVAFAVSAYATGNFLNFLS